MKKLLLAFLALPLLIASCKKSDSTSEIYKPSYHVDGISDRILQKSTSGIPASTTLYLTVTYANQDQERITLSMEDMPAGLAAKFTPASGFPTFSSSLILADSGVAAGEYTVKLVATGANSGAKSFPFNLSVLAAPDCSSLVTGTGYTSQTSCGGSTFSQNITATSGTSGRINFSNFDGSGAQVYGVISCSSGQITVPTQTANGFTYSGNGSYYQSGSQRTIYVSFTRSNGSGATNCTLNMYK